MTAVRFLVATGLTELLAAIGDAVETELMPSADPVSFPARHIFDSGQRILDGEADATRYDLRLTVEHYAEAPGGAAYQQVNDMYAATVAALLAEPSVENVETIDEGDTQIFTATLASASRLVLTTEFLISFPTRREDPAQPA